MSGLGFRRYLEVHVYLYVLLWVPYIRFYPQISLLMTLLTSSHAPPSSFSGFRGSTRRFMGTYNPKYVSTLLKTYFGDLGSS